MLPGSIRSLLDTFPIRFLIRLCSKCLPGASENPQICHIDQCCFQFAPMDPLFIADTVLAIETLSQKIGCITLLTTVYCSKCEKRGCLHIDLYTKHPILKVIMSANVKRRVPSYRLIHKAPQKAPYVEGYQFSKCEKEGAFI